MAPSTRPHRYDEDAEPARPGEATQISVRAQLSEHAERLADNDQRHQDLWAQIDILKARLDNVEHSIG